MLQFNGKLTSENGKLKAPAGSSIGRQSLLRRSVGAPREAVALYLSVSRTRRFIRRRANKGIVYLEAMKRGKNEG
jgi:hypothetical protein